MSLPTQQLPPKPRPLFGKKRALLICAFFSIEGFYLCFTSTVLALAKPMPLVYGLAAVTLLSSVVNVYAFFCILKAFSVES